MTQRLRVGVVGAGVIAQVMHLHYLRELAGHFEVVPPHSEGFHGLAGDDARAH